jgi:hypothetical protein
MHVYVYECMCVCLHAFVHVSEHACIFTCVCLLVSMHAYKLRPCMFACADVYLQVCLVVAMFRQTLNG